MLQSRWLKYVMGTMSFSILMSHFVLAEELPTVYLTLENHVFVPSEVSIPANKKVKLVIINKDNEPEEFDSFDLNRERVVFANKSATIYIGPLPPGKYEFFGEFHPESARGNVIVKEGD